MGIIIDYCRCDPFELNFRILALTGYWPVETKNKKLQLLYSAYSYLCWFSIISMLFIQVVDIYLLRNDPLNLIQNMTSSVVTFGSIAKYLMVFFRIEDTLQLHHQLNDFRKTRTDPEELRFVEKSRKEILWSTKSFYCLALPCVTAWMLYPGLESSEKKRIPFPYRLPIDIKKTPTYEILYTYQSMSMIGYMVNLLSIDLIFYGFVIRINAEYDMMISKMENVEMLQSGVGKTGFGRKMRANLIGIYERAATEKAKRALVEISKFHQKILSEIKQLENIYSRTFFFHITLVAFMVGLILIDILLVTKELKLQMLQRITFTLCGVFDTYLICLYGHNMQEKSSEFFRSIYSSSWYKASPELRRELMIISMQSSRVPKIKAGNIFHINLSTFLQLLKTTYNIVNLLFQTIRN